MEAEAVADALEELPLPSCNCREAVLTFLILDAASSVYQFTVCMNFKGKYDVINAAPGVSVGPVVKAFLAGHGTLDLLTRRYEKMKQ
jgi:hypothetical protein